MRSSHIREHKVRATRHRRDFVLKPAVYRLAAMAAAPSSGGAVVFDDVKRGHFHERRQPALPEVGLNGPAFLQLRRHLRGNPAAQRTRPPVLRYVSTTSPAWEPSSRAKISRVLDADRMCSLQAVVGDHGGRSGRRRRFPRAAPRAHRNKTGPAGRNRCS